MPAVTRPSARAISPKVSEKKKSTTAAVKDPAPTPAFLADERSSSLASSISPCSTAENWVDASWTSSPMDGWVSSSIVVATMRSFLRLSRSFQPGGLRRIRRVQCLRHVEHSRNGHVSRAVHCDRQCDTHSDQVEYRLRHVEPGVEGEQPVHH